MTLRRARILVLATVLLILLAAATAGEKKEQKGLVYYLLLPFMLIISSIVIGLLHILIASLYIMPRVFCFPGDTICHVWGGINNTLPYFMNITVALYVMAVAFTGMFFLFRAGSPRGRARARSMFIKLIMSMLFVILSPVLYQTMIDTSKSMVDAILYGGAPVNILNLIEIDIPGDFVSWSSFYNVTSVGKAIGIIFLGVGTIIVALPAVLVSLVRVVYVFVFAIIFPFIIFLYGFELTKPYGKKWFRKALKWIFTPVVQALILAFTISTATNMTMFSFSTASIGGIIGSLLASLLQILLQWGMMIGGLVMFVISPILMAKLMTWFGSALISYGYATTQPWAIGAGEIMSGAGPRGMVSAHSEFSRSRAYEHFEAMSRGQMMGRPLGYQPSRRGAGAGTGDGTMPSSGGGQGRSSGGGTSGGLSSAGAPPSVMEGNVIPAVSGQGSYQNMSTVGDGGQWGAGDPTPTMTRGDSLDGTRGSVAASEPAAARGEGVTTPTVDTPVVDTPGSRDSGAAGTAGDGMPVMQGVILGQADMQAGEASPAQQAANARTMASEVALARAAHDVEEERRESHTPGGVEYDQGQGGGSHSGGGMLGDSSERAMALADGMASVGMDAAGVGRNMAGHDSLSAKDVQSIAAKHGKSPVWTNQALESFNKARMDYGDLPVIPDQAQQEAASSAAGDKYKTAVADARGETAREKEVREKSEQDTKERIERTQAAGEHVDGLPGLDEEGDAAKESFNSILARERDVTSGMDGGMEEILAEERQKVAAEPDVFGSADSTSLDGIAAAYKDKERKDTDTAVKKASWKGTEEKKEKFSKLETARKKREAEEEEERKKGLAREKGEVDKDDARKKGKDDMMAAIEKDAEPVEKDEGESK